MLSGKNLEAQQTPSIHIDSSSLSVHGEYTGDEDSIKLLDDNESNSETLATTPRITHGFSKDYRPDLKQVVINRLY